MHDEDDTLNDEWAAGLLGDPPEPSPGLRGRVLADFRRERAAVIGLRQRRQRAAWFSLAACAALLLFVDVAVDRHDSAQVAALFQKNPPAAAQSAVAAVRLRRADVIALLRETDSPPQKRAGLEGSAAPALP